MSLDVPLHVKDVQRLGSDAPPLIPRILEISLRVPFRVRSVEQCDLDPVLPALATMARSRERIHRAGSMLGKLRLTVDFQVIYELSLNHNFFTRILARLEGFPPVSSTTLSMIQRWDQLLRELDRRRNRKLSLRQSYELHKMLKEMEDYPIEGSDLTLLYVSISSWLLIIAIANSDINVFVVRGHMFHDNSAQSSSFSVPKPSFSNSSHDCKM